MSGFFGAALTGSCILDLFFGTDYHSHLGTRRAGMVTVGPKGFKRAIHNIENTPFRTKFDKDLDSFEGNMGIGCISDYESQPLLIHSKLGSFAITTIGKINNMEQLVADCFESGMNHFYEMSTGEVNPTELAASVICQKDSFLEGLEYLQDNVDGSLSVLLLTREGIYAARDKVGRTPIVLGKKEDGYCCAFESSSFLNLGYSHERDLGPAEIVLMKPESVTQLKAPGNDMRICSFLWVYYGYPTSTYEGMNVERMRNRCGKLLARRDDLARIPGAIDCVAGVPDSGIAHAIGYGDTAIAKVSLQEDGKNGFKFTKWKLGSISFDDYSDKSTNNAITISAPKGSKVSINGVEVSDNYIKQDDVEFSPCKHVASYVSEPLRTIYEVSGLIAKPEIKAEMSGNQLEITNKNNAYTIEYPQDEELLSQMKDDIMGIARNYGKYIINRGSLSSLTKRMVGYANEYMSDIPAVWAYLYGKTYTYEFNNENISNFRKYSDNCFSCDVYYDLYVDWKDGNKTRPSGSSERLSCCKNA